MDMESQDIVQESVGQVLFGRVVAGPKATSC